MLTADHWAPYRPSLPVEIFAGYSSLRSADLSRGATPALWRQAQQ